MKKKTRITAGLTAGAASLLAAGAIAIGTQNASSAAETADPTASPSASAQSDSPRGGHSRSGGRGGRNQTPLTGADAEKATAAAEAAVEGGTVLRVEADSDGTFHAHVRKSDGTEVKVQLDKDFAVTAVQEFQARSGGRGGRNQTPLTGADAEKATAAAEAAVEGGTVLRVEADSDGTFHAHVRKSDGTQVRVNLDKDFAVTAVEESRGRSGGQKGQRGGSSTASPTATPSASA